MIGLISVGRLSRNLVVEDSVVNGACVCGARRRRGDCQPQLDAAKNSHEVTEQTGRRAVASAFHAGKWEQADQLAELVYAEFGRCDVLVNNAGMSPLYPSPRK